MMLRFIGKTVALRGMAIFVSNAMMTLKNRLGCKVMLRGLELSYL